MKILVLLLVIFAQTTVAGMKREMPEPKVMDDNPITITVVQGQTAILPCTVDPKYTEQHKDQYKVVWVSPKTTAISIEDRRMINDMRISVERPYLRDWNLHIRNVSITDAGTYMCQLNTEPVKSKRIHLLVQVPPMLVDYTQPVEIHKMEGEQVELFCNATGMPTPGVTWYRMNRWAKNGKERVGLLGEHLVIHNVTRMCADVYICIADNEVPPATKQEFTVDVNFGPEVQLHNQRIGQEPGKETILECVISGNPLHVTRWTFPNGSAISNTDHKYEVHIYDFNGEPHTIVLSLRIMRVELNDYGDYICEAINHFGTTTKAMTLYQVLPKLPPTTPPPTTTTTHEYPRFQENSANNVHLHGTGSRVRQPNYNGQSGNALEGGQARPANGIVAYDSTPGARPSGQYGSGSSHYKGIFHAESDIKTGQSNGAGSFNTQQSVNLVIVCSSSFALWTRLVRL